MKKLSMQQAADFLDDAACTEPPIDAGHDRVLNIGIDECGREFVLITRAWSGTAMLGYLH